MIHTNRRYGIVSVDRDSLAEKLTKHSWTLCTGFECEGFLWLNDAFSEDSAQEYAVFKDGIQVESITVSWCNPKRFSEIVNELHGSKEHLRLNAKAPQIDTNHGTCHLCA